MKSIYIDQEQIASIRSALPAREWLALWIGHETGLRVGDVVSLQRWQVGRSSILYRAQKTGKPGRAHISAELSLALERHRGFSGWLFPSPKDPREHLTRQAVWARVKRACKRAGIDSAGISPHSFRKVFAVEVFRRDGLAEAQRLLQHSHAATTEIYALSDYCTGANADKPLCRRDLQMLIELCVAALENRKG